MTSPTAANDRAMLERLARLVEEHAATVLASWRHSVIGLPSAARLDAPTLNDHAPRLLAELAAALRAGEAPPMLPPSDEPTGRASSQHGLQRLGAGLDIEEVVAEYGVLRRCLIEHAAAYGLVLQGGPLNVLNQLIDNAIGQAIRVYAAQQALAVQKRREDYLSVVAHDLRAPLHSVSLVTDVLESAASRPSATIDSARTVPMLRRNVQRLDSLVNEVLRENQSLKAEVPVAPRTSCVEVWPLVEKLLGEHAPWGADANEVPSALQAYGDPWLIEKLLRSLIERARGAEGARLRVQGKAAPPGRGVAVRMELTWPLATAPLPGAGVWPLPAGSGSAAAGDRDAANALKTLVDTHAATVHLERLDNGEALVVSWPATP